MSARKKNNSYPPNHILNIPSTAIKNIFSYLTCEEIAKNRAVCRKFNNFGGDMLGVGYKQVVDKHTELYDRLQPALEGMDLMAVHNGHPMSMNRIAVRAFDCDILQVMRGRMKILYLTFQTYCMYRLCYFNSGKLFDEMKNLLNMLDSPPDDSNRSPVEVFAKFNEIMYLCNKAERSFDKTIEPWVREKLFCAEELGWRGYSLKFGPPRSRNLQGLADHRCTCMKERQDERIKTAIIYGELIQLYRSPYNQSAEILSKKGLQLKDCVYSM